MNEVKYYLPLPYKMPYATSQEIRGKMFLGEKKATYRLGQRRTDREKDFIEKYSDRITRVHSSINFSGMLGAAYGVNGSNYIFFTDSKIELLYQLSFDERPEVIYLRRQCTLWEKIKDMVKNI
tara:strand:- start:2290 stop:2658 length:369 start_codon:yes stop_codon:yes gene_type:complete